MININVERAPADMRSAALGSVLSKIHQKGRNEDQATKQAGHEWIES
jgi:hypothetical protein